jgi:hypothetical protein
MPHAGSEAVGTKPARSNAYATYEQLGQALPSPGVLSAP